MDLKLAIFMKWSTIHIVFLNLSFLINNAESHILVYSSPSNQLIEEYNDLPAQFGPSLPPNGLKVTPVSAIPDDACRKVDPAPKLSLWKPVALIRRGENCSFEMKVRNAQAANYNAVIIYNNEGDDLEQMSASNSTGINIPSVFVGRTTGLNLKSMMLSHRLTLIINDELPFNINTQLILPFSILIGLCFLIMIFYMIYKCIREERRLRRYRLPKRMLKKLPITKFTKANDLSYDTCVICLEEFVEGDKMRILPCRHPYHSHCIDPWLTENRRVCPICKRKVFTKGEVRPNRNRQSSLDSVTDTDDDTTPLLRPLNTARAAVEAAAAATTRHGGSTFGGTRRTPRSAALAETNPTTTVANTTTDDENVLNESGSRRRMNPFNQRRSDATNAERRGNVSRITLFFDRLFRRRPTPISIAAPAFVDEVVQESAVQAIVAVASAAAAAAAAATPSTTATAISISNNILNPNLCGSFQDGVVDDDDDDDADTTPPHSIYEPIAVPITMTRNDDSVFIQTPTQGGIGVAALPNPTIASTNRDLRGASNIRRHHFLI